MTSIRDWIKDGHCVSSEWCVDCKDGSWQMGYLGYGGDTEYLWADVDNQVPDDKRSTAEEFVDVWREGIDAAKAIINDEYGEPDIDEDERVDMDVVKAGLREWIEWAEANLPDPALFEADEAVA